MLAMSIAEAQFRRFRGSGGMRDCLYNEEIDHVPPPTELVITRWRFGTNGLIGH